MASGPPYPMPNDVPPNNVPPNSVPPDDAPLNRVPQNDTPPYGSSPAPQGSSSAGQDAGEYRWLAPPTLAAAQGGAYGTAPGRPGGTTGRVAAYELRPLSTGEVLDRTFSLYRSRFLLFAGIAATASVVRLVGQGLQLAFVHTVPRPGIFLNVATPGALVSLPMAVVFLLAFAMTQAATMWAMGEVYLGREATVVGSLRATAHGWLRYLGIAFWQIGSALWPLAAVGAVVGAIGLANGRSLGGVGAGILIVLLVLAALVVGLIFYLRNLLAVPATVREGLGVRAAMRRSKMLVLGAKGKLFLVLLIAVALYFVMSILLATLIFVAVMVYHGARSFYVGEMIGLVIVFAGYTLISPVVMIGTGLVYFDQRVRKEAFDVAMLLGDEAALHSPADAAAAPSLSVAGESGRERATPVTDAELPVAEPPGEASGL